MQKERSGSTQAFNSAWIRSARLLGAAFRRRRRPTPVNKDGPDRHRMTMPEIEFVLEPGHELRRLEVWRENAGSLRERPKIVGRLTGLCLDVVEIRLKRHDRPSPPERPQRPQTRFAQIESTPHKGSDI